ncbi:MAG: SpoIVB peptidase S55 domain-containing protein, partial [Limnochordia bacterium]
MFNNRRTRGAGIVLIVLFCLVSSSLVAAQEEFWPLGMVTPGLRGTGKTVVEGQKVEEFEVEVVDILPGEGPVGDLVLIKVSGAVIDRMGGVGQGMSGSPIYFQNKLAGAIGYGFALTDHRIALMTPIVDMLPLLDEVSQSDS